MEKNYIEITRNLSANLKVLRADISGTMQGFSALAQAATRDGALDKKTKELIALALGLRPIAMAALVFIPRRS